MNLVTVAAFVRRRWATCRRWPRTRLMEWLAWYALRDRLYVLANGERVEGVALMRYVGAAEEAEEWYVDNDGPVAHVDLAVVRGDGLKDLFGMVWWHKGSGKKWIAWASLRRGHRAVVKEMEAVGRRFGYVKTINRSTGAA